MTPEKTIMTPEQKRIEIIKSYGMHSLEKGLASGNENAIKADREFKEAYRNPSYAVIDNNLIRAYLLLLIDENGKIKEDVRKAYGPDAFKD